MPRRKITLDEAMQVIKKAGMSIHSDVLVPHVPKVRMDYTLYPPQPMAEETQDNAAAPDPVPEAAVPKAVRIMLYARHTLAAAAAAGVIQSYGPGICAVPTALAGQLLHQDMLARQADDNLLSRQQKSFIVVERANAAGQRANVGLAVSEDTFGNLANFTGGTIHLR